MPWRNRATTLPPRSLCADDPAGRARQRLLALLVRRNIIDQLNQTMAVLPPCAEADSLADLEMETQRACAQIAQVRQSFFGGF